MFTQKISMSCTQEQYEKFLKDELLKMGYKEYQVEHSSWGEEGIIANNLSGEDNKISNLTYGLRNDWERTYLGSFNAPLFLALAAMTDKPEGNYGEYLFGTASGTLYKMISTDKMSSKYYTLRKATVSEIMEKFGEKKPIWKSCKEIIDKLEEKSTDLDKLAARVEKLDIEKCNLPKTEEELKNMMFAAYLTGQTDIINKQNGLDGRSFASWYEDNYKPISATAQPIVPEQYNVKQAVPYQLCPKCNGLGIADIYHPQFGSVKGICDLCKGEKIISMHVIKK